MLFFSNLVSGIGSHTANKIFGETLEDRQRYAMEQMAQQQEYNIENYERQKKDQLRFTDPSFIRERLERAGLSPSLALQNGASSPGMSATIGSSSTPGGFGSSSLAHGADLMESIARIRNINQDTENKKTENDYNRESMQFRLAILSNSKTAGLFENQIKAIDALIALPVSLPFGKLKWVLILLKPLLKVLNRVLILLKPLLKVLNRILMLR